MIIKKLFIQIVLIGLSLPLFAQDCFNYHKEHCFPEKSRFHYAYSDQSVSFLFASGEQKIISADLLNGKDYRITICADSVFEDIISFVIENDKKKVIYDNSYNNYSLNLEFTNKRSQTVKIKLTAPAPANGISDTIYLEGCIGFLLEEMNTLKTGF